MGWEVITDNLPPGDSLEELPVGYRVDRYFINAFFKAIRERVFFSTSSAFFPEDMDDLLFDEQEDPDNEPNQYTGIGVQELHRRLKDFNDVIVSMINKDFRGNTTWLWQEYVDQVQEGEQVFGFDNQDDFFPTSTGNINDRFWSEDDIIGLITNDTYESILDTSDIRKFKKSTYW